MKTTDKFSTAFKDNNELNILLFDGVCNLCNNTVLFIIKKDSRSKFKFASMQSESGQLLLEQLGLPLNNFNSLVFIRENRFYLKSDAVLRILRELGGSWKLLYAFIIIPRYLRDILYDFIANRRYRYFGKSDSCLVPTPEYQERFLT